MSQKLPVDGFKWNDRTMYDTIKNKNSDIGYIFKEDVKYPIYLNDLHSDLPFLPEGMTINKCSKLVCNLYDIKNTLFT